MTTICPNGSILVIIQVMKRVIGPIGTMTRESKQGYGHVYSRQVYSVDADQNQDEELSDEMDNPERAPVNPDDQLFSNPVNEDLNPDDITTLTEDELAFLGRTPDDMDPLDEHELMLLARKQKSLETETCNQRHKSQ